MKDHQFGLIVYEKSNSLYVYTDNPCAYYGVLGLVLRLMIYHTYSTYRINLP